MCSRGVYCDNKRAEIGRCDLYQIKFLAPIVSLNDFEICCFYFRPEESFVPKNLYRFLTALLGLMNCIG